MTLIRHFERAEIDSTQDEAFRLLESGQAPPFFVTADLQTSGRGRVGRSWHMEKGRSLAMTLATRLPAQRLEALSLVVGLSVLQALNRDDLKLKWPNDLMMNDQKVGGILIESRSSSETADIAIGIGLNLLSLQHASYSSLRQTIDAQNLAQRICENLDLLIEKGFSFFRPSYENLLWKKNEEVEFLVGGRKSKVRILGVNDTGQLKTEFNGVLSLNVDGEICLE